MTKEGYLYKKGHFRKNWKKRFVSLTPSSLAYFKAAGGKAKGIYKLIDCSVHECDPIDKRPFVFELKWKDKRSLYCACATDYERKVSTLTERIVGVSTFMMFATVDDIK